MKTTTTQTHTSAATSINAAKLPKVYSVSEFTPGEIILDYGCGRYTDHIRAALPERVQYYPLDPYNQPAAVNNRTRNAIRTAISAGLPITVICSNVLNVIDSDEEVQRIARVIRATAGISGGRYLVTVYEGNRTGCGRETKADCYQRNERTHEYLPLFPGAVIRRGVITREF